MGLFDRSTEGYETAPMELTVERGRIIAFAESIGETNPVHLDPDAARAKGYPDLLAPPTFPVVLDMDAAHQTRRKGDPSLLDRIGADMRALLHGTESYDYHGPIFAGDTLILTSRVTGFSDAKRGALEIVHLEMEITHPERGRLVTARRDLIHRLEGAA